MNEDTIEITDIEERIREAAKYLVSQLPELNEDMNEIAELLTIFTGLPRQAVEDRINKSLKAPFEINISDKINDSFWVAKKADPDISTKDAITISLLYTRSLNKDFTDTVLNKALSLIIGDH